MQFYVVTALFLSMHSPQASAVSKFGFHPDEKTAIESAKASWADELELRGFRLHSVGAEDVTDFVIERVAAMIQDAGE